MSNSQNKPGVIDKIHNIKHMLDVGYISFDEAKILALPLIREMEESAEKVAKKFGTKPPKFSFTNLIR